MTLFLDLVRAVLIESVLLSFFLFSPNSLSAFSFPIINSDKQSGDPIFDNSREATLRSNYGKLPTAFEVNEGQTDSRVRFIARGSGYVLYLTDLETVISLDVYKKNISNSQSELKIHKNISKLLGRDVLRLSLPGASRGISFEALNPLSSISNYFVGKDSGLWKTKLRQYSQVLAHDVYPGIDMIYYGQKGQLEYDFRVKPGADPKVIRVRHEGAENTTVAMDGSLRLKIGKREVRFKKPEVYQEEGGITTVIEGKYVRIGKDEIGFEVGDYDKMKTLIIDPALVYSTFLGGNGSDRGAAIAVDSSGNAYITGAAQSTDFPTTAGAFQRTMLAPMNYANAYVAKLNPAGNALVYSTYIGGSSNDMSYGIGLDLSGNAYIAGITNSINYPTTSGAFQTTLIHNTYNGFVTKLNSTGTALIYSTYLGENANGIQGYAAIAVDSLGFAYVTGETQASDYPTTAGAFQTRLTGFPNAYVTKLNTTGTALIYSTYLGGNNQDVGNGIAVDSAGNAYVAGGTYSNNFPTTSGAFERTFSGLSDVFVTKVNPTGSALVYSTLLTGTGLDGNSAFAIALDSSGNAYVTGHTNSSDFPTTSGAYKTSYSGGVNDAFVTKVNVVGSGLVYSTFLGGAEAEAGTSIAVDSAGNAYLTGITNSTDFPTTSGAFQRVNRAPRGGVTAFVTELNATGNSLVYSTYLGGTGQDEGNGIAVDSSNSIYVTGQAGSTDFPITSGAFQVVHGTGYDNAFVAKLGIGVSVPTATATNTDIVVAVQTNTPTATLSLTMTPASTITPTPTITSVAHTPTVMATNSATVTVTPTATITSGDGFFVSKNVFTTDNPVLIHVSTADGPGNYALSIFNSAGENIKNLDKTYLLGPFQQTYSWDGRNKFGNPCASGVYIIHVTLPFKSITARVIFIH
ncbi:MAG TPA: SBBP repeat-containing protein [bacterium]|jgi:hypothetical protein|nr:SBBP repeat-containing protein [bacterium]